MDAGGPTRDRIVAEAMRLFGERGYAATTVAEIEAAAGLSPGSGGLYRHFRSKYELLAEGVRRQVEAGEDLVAFVGDRTVFAALPLRQRLAVLARAGLRRLDQERDLSRLLRRDLSRFPDLLAQVREEDSRRAYRAVQRWCVEQARQVGQERPGQEAGERDWAAVAAVLVSAVAHYWTIGDIFGAHPAGVDEDRYVAAFAELAAGLFEGSEVR